MNAARQLCKASNTISDTERPLKVCPHCGTNVVPEQHVWIQRVGSREKRPIIPAHPRHEHGELRMQMQQARERYPRPDGMRAKG